MLTGTAQQHHSVQAAADNTNRIDHQSLSLSRRYRQGSVTYDLARLAA